MKILDIKNLSLSFNLKSGVYEALHNVSVSLEKGKTIAIVGESGSGKTLTISSVIRLIPNNSQITSGEIIYNNQDILKLPLKKMSEIRGKEIALIPQDPMTSLNPLYTIGNQLKEVIEIHKNIYGKEADIKAEEALDLVKIPDSKNVLKKYPHELSGGMKQRVAIASAIACGAKIIIADEPTTALDVTVQAQILKLLNDVQKEFETSIILISHDLALVSENADETYVMYAGRIVEHCKNKNIFFNPKHPYTKALLNSIPTFDDKKIFPIEGTPPTIKDNFTGCAFAKRCNFAFEKCQNNIPKLYDVDNDTCSACFLNN